MPLASCPSCRTRLTVTGKLVDRKVVCPCGRTFLTTHPEDVPAETDVLADGGDHGEAATMEATH
jgi:hypothetical protein